MFGDLVAINLAGSFYVLREAARVMQPRRSGAIVNTGSELALIGQPGYVAYTATKGAIVAMTRSAAAELVSWGIRVNAVCPGTTKTPLLFAEFDGTADPESEMAENAASVAVGRFAEPREIAEAVVFLLSERASYLIGTHVVVDGGRSTAYPLAPSESRHDRQEPASVVPGHDLAGNRSGGPRRHPDCHPDRLDRATRPSSAGLHRLGDSREDPGGGQRQVRSDRGPVHPFGYRSRPGSGGGQHFPGTLSLRATTFIALLEDILGELHRCGFRNIVLYNWHYKNSGFIPEPAYLIAEQHQNLKIVVIEDVNPDFTPDRQQAIWPDGFPGLALGRYPPSSKRRYCCTTSHLWSGPTALRPTHRSGWSTTMCCRSTPGCRPRVGRCPPPVAASAEKGRLLTEWMVAPQVTSPGRGVRRPPFGRVTSCW